MSAAIASVSSTRIGMSQTRTSSVVKNGCGRTSHQIFFALSMQLVRTSRLTKFSKSAHDVNVSGMFVRGKRSKTLQRYDFRPVFMPIQNGELVESASRCGRKYRIWFMSWMSVSRSSMPTWTCRPKIRFARATICMSSTTCR